MIQHLELRKFRFGQALVILNYLIDEKYFYLRKPIGS